MSQGSHSSDLACQWCDWLPLPLILFIFFYFRLNAVISSWMLSWIQPRKKSLKMGDWCSICLWTLQMMVDNGTCLSTSLVRACPEWIASSAVRNRPFLCGYVHSGTDFQEGCIVSSTNFYFLFSMWSSLFKITNKEVDTMKTWLGGELIRSNVS